MSGAPPIAPPKGNDFLAYALWYAKLGFRVIPLREYSSREPERAKEPQIADWPNKATTDEATIRGWWRKWPKANIGIATGRYDGGYFCVLDFDPRNGGDWYNDAPKGSIPDTWVVHTGGGGRHFYYKTPYPLRGGWMAAPLHNPHHPLNPPPPLTLHPAKAPVSCNNNAVRRPPYVPPK